MKALMIIRFIKKPEIDQYINSMKASGFDTFDCRLRPDGLVSVRAYKGL
jgi:hypothetical protein